ncbi:MAG: cell division protein FtsX [Taibaiella sp.]|nr:cell division protein FtsX [Taibaiella sp.]
MSTGKKAKPTYFNAILGVALVLFLLGVLGWLLINGRALSRAFKEDLEVSVDFHDNTTDANVTKMQQILDRQGFVRHSHIITKDEAVKMENEVEGTNVMDFLGYNPLFTSIALKMHEEYVNKDSLDKIKKFLLQSNVVRDVTWSNVVVDQMNNNFRKIGIILGGISVMLLIVVIFLIDNTVRLAMFSNRFLIKTMQMVGATRSFITRPFDIRALLNGLISGLLAVVALWMVISFATKQLPVLSLLNDPLLLGCLMCGMILLGIVISLVSTHRSVIKYLKLHVDDLY